VFRRAGRCRRRRSWCRPTAARSTRRATTTWSRPASTRTRDIGERCPAQDATSSTKSPSRSPSHLPPANRSISLVCSLLCTDVRAVTGAIDIFRWCRWCGKISYTHLTFLRRDLCIWWFDRSCTVHRRTREGGTRGMGSGLWIVPTSAHGSTWLRLLPPEMLWNLQIYYF